MKMKKNIGGILVYVLMIGFIMMFFLSLLFEIFGVALEESRNSSRYLQNQFLQQNIFENSLARYKKLYTDFSIYTQQDGQEHSISRFQNDLTPFLNSHIADESKIRLEFHKNQREIPFMYTDVDTGNSVMSHNSLSLIKTFKISWNIDHAVESADKLRYNPLSRIESADLRITMIRQGAVGAVMCFNTTNADVAADIVVNGNFKQSFVVKESYFRSASTGNADCTAVLEGDALATPPVAEDQYFGKTILNNDGANVLDFSNNSYVLIIEALTGSTHVRVNDNGGNAGYIPTSYIDFSLTPEKDGEIVSVSSFIGGSNTLGLTVLESSSESYNGEEILPDTEITLEIWNFLIDKLQSNLTQ
ncbi:hypothetical protein COB57_02500 [Candidatus Peregrinibacteria bacterium]|nr:MAG: hypothetical protein COB57_02500 [Candidatus Peregrinibacteria bacterium]